MKGQIEMGSITSIIAGIVSISVIAAVTILTWHGSIDGQAAIGILGTIIGGGGVATIAHVAVQTGAKAAKTN